MSSKQSCGSCQHSLAIFIDTKVLWALRRFYAFYEMITKKLKRATMWGQMHPAFALAALQSIQYKGSMGAIAIVSAFEVPFH